MQTFFFKYAKNLQNTKIENYFDSDAIIFSLVEIAYNELVDKYGCFVIPLDENKIKKLQRKKSGLPIAVALLQNKLGLIDKKEIITKNFYKGDSDSKKQRHYSNIEVENEIGEQFVFVLCHSSDKLWSNEEMIEQFRNDAYKFVELLDRQSYSIK